MTFDGMIINNAIISAICDGNDTIVKIMESVADQIGIVPKIGDLGKTQSLQYAVAKQLIFLVDMGKIEWLVNRRYRIVDEVKKEEYINGH